MDKRKNIVYNAIVINNINSYLGIDSSKLKGDLTSWKKESSKSLKTQKNPFVPAKSQQLSAKIKTPFPKQSKNLKQKKKFTPLFAAAMQLLNK